MKIGWLEYCSFLFFTLAVSAEMPSTSKDKSGLEALTEGSNRFAIALYQAISKTCSGNLIVSPISLQLVLALAYAGTKGPSAEEIAKALGLPKDEEEVLTSHKRLIQELQNPVLKLANKIFVDSQFTLKPDFLAKSINYFGSEVLNVNFKEQPDESRQTINKWVEDATDKKIKDLLLPGIITPSTSLVLTNAVHFKAKWLHEFSPDSTTDMPFYVTPDNPVQVPMMHQTDYFGFVSNSHLGANILELPYAGREFRMVIILPNAIDGLAQVEAKLMTLNLVEVFSTLRRKKVDVTLPRFKIEETLDLNDILKSLGIKSIFDEKAADFSGMVGSVPLVVSSVLQKAFIEVNEEGTEAAAATAMIMMRCSLPIREEKETFIADHPFLFLIQHNASFLFIGSCTTGV